jgi:hypothetical protein
MVEPEIAFADLSDDADLAESLLKASFTALLHERADDMAFFAERIDPDAVKRLENLVTSRFERMTYTEAIAMRAREPELGVPGPLGRRAPGGARALPVRGARAAAGRGHRLPQGDQGVLHAPQRRRPHGRRDGRPGARHR